MIIHPDKYLYDGNIIKDESCRIGYASQFAVRDKEQECTVFEYLSERFVENQQATVAVCEGMAVAEDVELLFEKYQALLDAFEAMDGDNYANNIRKQLYVAGMRELEETTLSQLSGGEYRLRARQIKAPFTELREPKIELQAIEVETEQPVLSITDYNVSFDESLLENINFELLAGEKVAIVGANGTGKTTLMRDILKNNHPSIHIDENTSYACLSQLQGENIDETKTVYEVMENLGFETRESIREYLGKYCLEGDTLKQKVGQLSSGEKNLLQIAMIANTNAELLILDEPTSHLDIYAQMALEKAISEYKGAVLMVSHDFYLVANCADYVLLVEDNTIRHMRTRSFRKMVYDKYFDQKYLEIDKKKQELEANITLAFKKNELITVEKLCNQLEALSAE